jgi:membrane fusion protein (multidrug efflux system)
VSLDEIDRPAPVKEAPVFEPPPSAPAQAPGSRRDETTAWYRRPLWLLAVLAAAAAIIVGGVLWWLEARQWESTDDAFIDAHMVLVAPQVAGRVARVLVNDNQEVAAGQLMVQLDPAYFQAQLDQAVANRAAAEGSLAQAKAQLAEALATAQESAPRSGSPKPMRQTRSASSNARNRLSHVSSRRASSSTATSQMPTAHRRAWSPPSRNLALRKPS